MKRTVEALSVAARNMLLGGNLAALRMLRSPRTMISYVNECLFMQKTIGRRRGLPQKNVYEIFQSNNQYDVTLSGFSQSNPWLWEIASYTQDIISLCLLCRILQPCVVFEIGTFQGYTAAQMALNTPASAKIFTLDLPPEGVVAPALNNTITDQHHIVEHSHRARVYAFKGTPAEAKIQLLFGDSATFDFSPYCGCVDLFFIDGAHSYEYVRNDTLKAMECCHPGSVIAWHDFGRQGVNGVSRWLCELRKKGHEIYTIPGGSLAYMRVR
jgi:predicted O-methyltransferase YrrM